MATIKPVPVYNPNGKLLGIAEGKLNRAVRVQVGAVLRERYAAVRAETGGTVAGSKRQRLKEHLEEGFDGWQLGSIQRSWKVYRKTRYKPH